METYKSTESQETIDYSNPEILRNALKNAGIWNDGWNDGLVSKLALDVKNGERTFSVSENGELYTTVQVASGSIEYSVQGSIKGFVVVNKGVKYIDAEGNNIPERTKTFTEKKDRTVGGKIKVGDNADSTFNREAEEELPEELASLVFAGEINIGQMSSTSSRSPGYPNLLSVYEVYPVVAKITPPEGFDISKSYIKTEEQKLPNGETKITTCTYVFEK